MRQPDLELFWIPSGSPPETFPDVRRALRNPDGLLAAGGDLSPARLIYAYRHGIFPWYEDSQPILWWSPDPRAVIFPNEFHLNRSLRKQLRRGGFVAEFDTAFSDVMTACAAPRPGHPAGTWITPAMRQAYGELHRLGFAHSMEIRQHGELTGGLYGVALGGVFFGESMFSRRTNASKIALACLAKQLQAWGFGLIDCQVHSAHLESLGSVCLPQTQFIETLECYLRAPDRTGTWHFEVPLEF